MGWQATNIRYLENTPIRYLEHANSEIYVYVESAFLYLDGGLNCVKTKRILTAIKICLQFFIRFEKSMQSC